MLASAATDIEATLFDLIVIGAGINGAGIARDASQRGLRVLLLDKGDIASGTTSWSTRLIHGGLRYLEHGEVSLVRESLRERERLFKIAPHLVRPLPMIIPIYERQRRGPLKIRAGMIAYDLLSLDKSLGRHQMLSREETLRRVPGLRAEGLRGAALYYDAQVEYAERLVLENALSAREHGAQVHTYARVERFIVEEGAVRGLEFRDEAQGGLRRVRAHVTVNVSGPWVDSVLGALERPQARLIGGTKGSHIVVYDFPGAPTDALYVEAHEDGRPFFIIRWNGMYLIGTTDSPYDGDPGMAAADEREIEYLLRETNRIIPSAALSRASVLYTYSGVRPLAYEEGRAGGSITRRHFVHDHAGELEGFLSIVGGKLTTYRNLSEQAVDLVFKKLGREPRPRCETARLTLPGASLPDFAAFAQHFKSASGLAPEVADHLLRVYGARAPFVLELAAEGPDLAELFSPRTGAIGAEVLMSFRHEMARTLTDCLLRRTMVGMNGSLGLDAVEAAARIAQKYLGWSRARAEQETAAYRQY
ncbi:MAG TPA: glycerol-3-phosphate dehydrogenase, partial [Pyrinomonadaceae bacterium]|nr:glycerol-3-phosphate dehydrogenase [Pyrinomonadaceae bacterium]